MAGAGYKLFATGDVLTAAQVNTYLNEQTVMVFANAAARTSALTSVLAEGMVSYLQDTNAVEVYNGSAWVGVGNVGDITEVQAGVGISIASGTGPIPVITNSSTDLITTAGDILYGTAADTVARLGIGTAGKVLKVNSSATAPEWAVDPTTDVVTTAGDLIYATAADTVTRLGIGTAGQVLKVNSGATAPEWATPAGGGKVLQVVYGSSTTATTITSTSTFGDTSLSASITPSAATSKVLVLVAQQFQADRNSNDFGVTYKLVRASTDVLTTGNNPIYIAATAAPPNTTLALSMVFPITYLDSPNTTSATTYKTQGKMYGGGSVVFQGAGGGGTTISTMILLEIGA